jgi:hypothetical protein
MLLAAIAPVLWALMGFVAGATMAFLYNLSVIDASKDEIALVTLRHPQRAVGQAASLTATTNLLCEQTRDVFSNSGAAAEKLDVFDVQIAREEKSRTAMRSIHVHQSYSTRGHILSIAIIGLALLAFPSSLKAQDTLGGHIGFVLPLVTQAGGDTTSIADNFSIGFPMGVTIKGKGRTAFDLELVPSIQDTPRQVSLLVHPGVLWGLGHGFTFGMRGAFDVNTSQYGFTPLLNKAWPIQNGSKFFKAYFAEAVLPVRFNRPTGGPSTNAVTFGVHFGVGF